MKRWVDRSVHPSDHVVAFLKGSTVLASSRLTFCFVCPCFLSSFRYIGIKALLRRSHQLREIHHSISVHSISWRWTDSCFARQDHNIQWCGADPSSLAAEVTAGWTGQRNTNWRTQSFLCSMPWSLEAFATLVVEMPQRLMRTVCPWDNGRLLSICCSALL